VNPREEHLATRSAAGLFDFSFMGLYEFHEKSSIQRLQTRDLSALEPGRVAYTLLLNPDGSVFNDATVWNMGAERWWLFTGRPGDIAWLGTAARNRSGEHAILALQGPVSGRILARLIGADTVRGLRYFHFVQLDSLLVARLGYSGELGYELMVPAAEEPRLRSRLLDAGHTYGLCEASFEAANSLRIESGYVLFDREIDGRANPRELGLERVVSNQQRVFGLSRKLVGLEIADRQPDANLPVAHVTSECDSPTLGKSIALAFGAPDTQPGDFVRLGEDRFARVAKLPFYDPERRRPRAVAIRG
jgi:glycine cleavage system T protein (aminomethyltransferase)